MKPSVVVWWRYGKEHGQPDEFRVNSPAVIAAHLDQKLAACRATPEAEWRWWEVDDGLLVERPDPSAHLSGPETRVYYLIDRGLAVIENIRLAPPEAAWSWYLHLADISFDASRQCWVKKDLFTDILVHQDGCQHRIVDLDDLATAIDIGLLTVAQAGQVLRRTEATARAIYRGEFPFPEVERARTACGELGW